MAEEVEAAEDEDPRGFHGTHVLIGVPAVGARDGEERVLDDADVVP
jgi:hypothetical protein